MEPNIDALPASSGVGNVELTDLRSAVERADIVVLLVDHDPFKALPAARLGDATIIDTRGIWR